MKSKMGVFFSDSISGCKSLLYFEISNDQLFFLIEFSPVANRDKIYLNKSARHYLKREAGASEAQALLLF